MLRFQTAATWLISHVYRQIVVTLIYCSQAHRKLLYRLLADSLVIARLIHSPCAQPLKGMYITSLAMQNRGVSFSRECFDCANKRISPKMEIQESYQSNSIGPAPIALTCSPSMSFHKLTQNPSVPPTLTVTLMLFKRKDIAQTP